MPAKKRDKSAYNSATGFFKQRIDNEAPIIVCDCIAFIRNRGLYETGIFRVPGSLDVVNVLKQKYDTEFSDKASKLRSRTSVLNDHRPEPSVHDVASLLKAYFKELEYNLIPEANVNALTKVIELQLPKDKEAEMLSKQIKMIPSPNRECLGFLVSFWREICSFKKFNSMTADNIATCFVLSLMGGGEVMNQISILKTGSAIIKKLITCNLILYTPSMSDVEANTKYKDITWPPEPTPRKGKNKKKKKSLFATKKPEADDADERQKIRDRQRKGRDVLPPPTQRDKGYELDKSLLNEAPTPDF